MAWRGGAKRRLWRRDPPLALSDPVDLLAATLRRNSTLLLSTIVWVLLNFLTRLGIACCMYVGGK
jgi:hypothetical protein